jgi:hypothetical protein
MDVRLVAIVRIVTWSAVHVYSSGRSLKLCRDTSDYTLSLHIDITAVNLQ